MNSKKAGKLFIVLIISLIAFGSGSFATVLNSGNQINFGTLPSISATNNGQQISTIGDPSFQPTHVMRQFYNTTTNSTNSTSVNSTTNSTGTNSSRNSTRRTN